MLCVIIIRSVSKAIATDLNKISLPPKESVLGGLLYAVRRTNEISVYQ